MTESTITTVDPRTGDVIAEYPTFDDARIEAAITDAHAATVSWAATPLTKRLELLRALAETLRAGRDEYAALMTREMGKPITEAAGEVEKSAVTAEYYVANATHILADEHVEIEGVRAWVGYEPLGVVYAVMPWNFPFWQVMRFAIPTLAAGNAVLLKHSPNVTGSALAIQQLLHRAGFPDGLLTTLVVAEPDVPAVSDRIIADDRVAAVTAAVKARFHNSGQSCVCAKRFLVADAVGEEFTRLFVEKTRALTVGDPTDPASQVRPMARLARSISSGAVFVNAVVASDPRLPFGGTKRSGHGRELAAAGIREFTTIRTYWVTTSAADRIEPDTRGD